MESVHGIYIFVEANSLDKESKDSTIKSIHRMLIQAVDILDYRDSLLRKVNNTKDEVRINRNKLSLLRCIIMVRYIESCLRWNSYRCDTQRLYDELMRLIDSDFIDQGYDDCSKVYQDYYMSMFCLSECFIQQGLYEDAIPLLEAVNRLFSKDSERKNKQSLPVSLPDAFVARACLGLSRCYYNLNNKSQAFCYQEKAKKQYRLLCERNDNGGNHSLLLRVDNGC